MRKNKCTKKILTLALAFLLAGSLTGCGGSQQESTATTYSKDEYSTVKAMKVGDQDIYMDEMNLYALQELIMQEASPKTFEVNESTYKEEVLSMIRERVIMYNVVQNNDYELEEKDREAGEQLAANFKAMVSQDILDEYGISDELIDRVFEEQAAIQSFQDDIQNEMGQQIYDDFMEVYADYSFHESYYMVFPTVEVDENGNPKTTGETASNGDAIYEPISDAEKQEVKKQADAAVAELRAGAKPEDVAEKYGVSAYSTVRTGYVGMYSDEMNKALEGLKTGECTDPMETPLGYAVTYLTEADSEEMKETYVYYLSTQNLNTEYETLRQRWLATIPVDPEADMYDTVWADYSLRPILDTLVDQGVLPE